MRAALKHQYTGREMTVREVFDSLDVDDSGYLDRDELEMAGASPCFPAFLALPAAAISPFLPPASLLSLRCLLLLSLLSLPLRPRCPCVACGCCLCFPAPLPARIIPVCCQSSTLFM